MTTSQEINDYLVHHRACPPGYDVLTKGWTTMREVWFGVERTDFLFFMAKHSSREFLGPVKLRLWAANLFYETVPHPWPCPAMWELLPDNYLRIALNDARGRAFVYKSEVEANCRRIVDELNALGAFEGKRQGYKFLAWAVQRLIAQDPPGTVAFAMAEDVGHALANAAGLFHEGKEAQEAEFYRVRKQHADLLRDLIPCPFPQGGGK